MEPDVCREAGADCRWIERMSVVVSQFHIEQRLAVAEEK